MILEWACLVLAALYLIKVALFRAGALHAQRTTQNSATPFVSVIVAARNEEANIDRCLAALAALDYPADRCEIIVMNDQSTDGTAEKIAAWQQRIPNLIPMETVGRVHDLHGKANAVAQAIEHSRGEIVCTTDADCAVPPTWIRSLISCYDESVGAVCGFTLLNHKSLFTGMQSLDWAYLLTIASAGVGWGFPLSAVGNNMSFRRKAYDDVGGYAGIGFSVTEDFLLFKSIAYKTRWHVRYPIERDALVWSEPCATLRELYLQKKRWGRGGVRIHPVGYFIMSVGFMTSIAVLATPFLLASLWYWIGLLAVKCAGDWWLLRVPLRRLSVSRLIKYFFPFELYYVVYVSLLPFIVALTGRVRWKGRSL